MKKVIIILLLLFPLISAAQLPFVIHMPFQGEPLFCHEQACIRKAAVAKKIKKNKHKRKVAARKASRKGKEEMPDKVIESSPPVRLRPKFE